MDTMERCSLQRVRKLEYLIDDILGVLCAIEGQRDDNHIIYDELTREQLLEQISLIRAEVEEAAGMCTKEVPYKGDPREHNGDCRDIRVWQNGKRVYQSVLLPSDQKESTGTPPEESTVTTS